MKTYDPRGRWIVSDPCILGIESSCDETACAVIRGRKLLSDVIISSAPEQAKYGGVVPEIASRAHTDAVDEAAGRAVAEAGVALSDIDAVAVTYGAGLLGALLVGLSFAKGLAYTLGIPLLAVSHIRGHVASAYLERPDLEPPFVTLLASGGHTAILRTGTESGITVLAETCDDAAGEAFDKCARVLGLPYPGGPNLERLAREGRPSIGFPSAEVRDRTALRFSYSGLKTSVINYCHGAEARGEEVNKADVAASFQRSAIEPLVMNTVSLAEKTHAGVVTAGGGVAANGYLRERLTDECARRGLDLVLPEKRHCTDNAAMIASEGLNMYMRGEFSPLDVNAAAQVRLK